MARGASVSYEAALEALRARGARAHPTVAVEADQLRRYVEARAADAAAVAALVAEDVWLACALAAGDPRALASFEANYLARTHHYLGHRARPEVVDEVKQRTRARLFVAEGGHAPKITEYAGRGPLDAWVRVVVMRVGQNLARQDKDHEDIDAVTLSAAAGASPEYVVLRARALAAFDAAIRAAFAAAEDEERALFRWQYREGLTLDEIARMMGVHRATAARRLAAAKKALSSRVMDALGEQLGATRPEVEEALAEWRSKIDVSLSGLLRA